MIVTSLLSLLLLCYYYTFIAHYTLAIITYDYKFAILNYFIIITSLFHYYYIIITSLLHHYYTILTYYYIS